ncbi:MAG TPA: MotA/TolQ/ExbB proton channel family protein [Planctomycetota bacterium]|nr:MotA/TolQ/ExbB proton channel family protein [Planctomycetota bacterium]
MGKSCTWLSFLLVVCVAAAAGGEAATPAPPGPAKAPSGPTEAPERASTVLPVAGDAAAPGDSERGSIIGKNLWETFLAGGVLMWPILAASIIGLAFIFERAVALRQRAVIPPGVGKAVVDAARGAGIAEAQRLCEEKPSALSRVLATGLAVADRSREEMETAMEEAGEREQWQMDRFNRPLSIVTSVAPLLGLLGTVQGMIMAFDVVAQKGAMGDPRQLAAGVATALLTTFAGLAVAIPCYCFYHYYRDKADRMIVQIEDSASHLADALKGSPKHADSSPP